MRAIVLLAAMSATVRADEAADLAVQAKAFFTTHCYRCHGQNGAAQGGFDNVLNLKKLVETKRVIPKDTAKSRIFKRINPDLIGDMPDDTLTKPTAAEIAMIAKWIDAGAPEGVAEVLPPRAFFKLEDEVKAIDDYLMNKVEAKKWPSYRFFSLRNLYNMPREEVKDTDLLLYQAALSKLLNSLSWKKRIVIPEMVDDKGIILAVNVDDLDWTIKNLWREILKVYPYGLSHERYPENPAVNNRWKSIIDKTGAEIPVLRTDWFVAQAARPPLYHTLAQIPSTVQELTRRIPVGDREYLDLDANVAAGKVARAGFNGSGVSERNNRLIERHETSYGAFWISYDFKVSAGKGNLFVFPLGPSFKTNPFERHAFKHDGGEVIFNLPNGLQGYMLIKADGTRIDEGPIEIVSDGKAKISGTPAIVNGVSCMACHQHGMIRKADQVRESHALGGNAKQRVDDIYLKEAEMDRHYETDEKRFQDALTACVKPYLMTGQNANKTIKDFAEPIGPIAKWYVAGELSLADTARELGLEKPALLAGMAEGNEDLQRAGLLPLARGKNIKREVWESQQFLYSPFQVAAQKLKYGEPVVVK